MFHIILRRRHASELMADYCNSTRLIGQLLLRGRSFSVNLLIVIFNHRRPFREGDMALSEVIGVWWDTLRIPLVVVAIAAWIYLDLMRRNAPARRSSATVVEEDAIDIKAPVVVDPVAEAPREKASVPAVATAETGGVLTTKRKKSPKKFTRGTAEQPVRTNPDQTIPLPVDSESSPQPEIHIFYASQFNHTSTLAKHLLTLLTSYTRLHDISTIPNLDDYFLQHPSNAFYFLLLPSYANDSGPTQPLIDALEDTLNDFRVDANPLSKVRGFAVFGTGDREGWPDRKEFCYQALKVEKLLERLGARRAFAMGMGDAKGRASLTSQLEGWAKRVLTAMNTPPPPPSESTNPKEEHQNEIEEDEYDSAEEDPEQTETPLLDVEDIALSKRPSSSSVVTDFTPKPMVSSTSTTYSALTKQGYTIVGTHSGVKICRWTKSALRGRGSCYKFSFYGIKSHLCMETTPSLACANKCVFCWRHGTNPVGTTWRWQVDPPEVVYRGALEGHYKKINMLKGMMGVKAVRYEEAKRVRHCALSLVGEPIFCTFPFICSYPCLGREN
jgi:tRNA wybutosine-synthesizing protein 1